MPPVIAIQMAQTSSEADGLPWPILNALMRSGWHGSIREFLACDRENWIQDLERHVLSSMGDVASQSNRRAWLNSHRVLQEQLAPLASRRDDVADWGIVFEYELPRERGRRPDVVILAGQLVLVLEFKDFADTLPAHVDQVAAYARDLASYQSATHHHDVIPILINTLSDSAPVESGSVWITGAADLSLCIEQTGVAGHPWMSITEWIQSPYAPLPSLVRAARMIFRHEPLPRIRQAESTGVNDAVAAVCVNHRRGRVEIRASPCVCHGRTWCGQDANIRRLTARDYTAHVPGNRQPAGYAV